MAGLVRQECLACTHHATPVCDGSGVLLKRWPNGDVDVNLCPRWPASWDEPLAYFEALAQHDIDAVPVTTVPEKIWPAVQAEIVRTNQASADDAPLDGQEPTWSEAGPSRALGYVLMLTSAMLVVLALLVVFS